MRTRYFLEEESKISSEEKEKYVNSIRKKKPTEIMKLLASDDKDIYEKLEKGTEAYILWKEALDDLKVNEALTTKQTLLNIRRLKNYIENMKLSIENKTDDDIDYEEADKVKLNPETSGREEPKETVLDNSHVQDLLCDSTRSFIKNIKQEVGNILLAFSARVIGLMSELGVKNPDRGAFYLVKENSKLVCSAIINAISEYTQSSPSVIGVQVRKDTNDLRSIGLAHGVSTVLLNKLMKVFDEEVIVNPEDVIKLGDDNQEVVDVSEAINVSDLIHINKSRRLVQDGCYTIYSALRMRTGSYNTNFNFGIQVIPVTDLAFNLLFYMYLSDNLSKPDGQFRCTNWV